MITSSLPAMPRTPIATTRERAGSRHLLHLLREDNGHRPQRQDVPAPQAARRHRRGGAIHFDPSDEALGVAAGDVVMQPAPTACTRSTARRSSPPAAPRRAGRVRRRATSCRSRRWAPPSSASACTRSSTRSKSRTCARSSSAPSTARASPAPRSSSRRPPCATTTPTGTACSSIRSSSPRRRRAWPRGSTPSTATSSSPARCSTTSARRRPTPATAWPRS